MSRLITAWTRPSRPAVDDAYTAWFNAHSRCAHALRLWHAATPATRAHAHRAYLAELDQEEAAARELERLHREFRAAA